MSESRGTAPAARTFTHEDGRRWSAAIEGGVLRIVIELPDDDEPIVREQRLSDARAAARARDELCAEQLADGFIETTPSIEKASVLEGAVLRWRAADPAFDVAPLEASIAPHRSELEPLIGGLRTVWVDEGNGSFVGDNDAQRAGAEAAEAGFRALPPVAVEAALLLALRAAVAALGTRVSSAALPALVSCIERFAPCPNDLPGAVADLLHPSRFAELPRAVIERLIGLLDDAKWETRSAALDVLAPRAEDPQIFDACFAKRSDPLGRVRLVQACARRQPRRAPVARGAALREGGAGMERDGGPGHSRREGAGSLVALHAASETTARADVLERAWMAG